MAQPDRAFQRPDLYSTRDQNLQLLIGGTLPWPYNKRARIFPDPVGDPTWIVLPVFGLAVALLQFFKKAFWQGYGPTI